MLVFAVVCPIVDIFTASLAVNKDERVKAVTMLRQEICVLCFNRYSSPHAIRVFQNRNPYQLSEKIEISLVKDLIDMGSSSEENCFFVLDPEDKCVWRIARQTGDYHKFLHLQFTHFFRWPLTLSVSSDGQELLIPTLRSLEIYRLVRSDQRALKAPATDRR